MGGGAGYSASPVTDAVAGAPARTPDAIVPGVSGRHIAGRCGIAEGAIFHTGARGRIGTLEFGSLVAAVVPVAVAAVTTATRATAARSAANQRATVIRACVFGPRMVAPLRAPSKATVASTSRSITGVREAQGVRAGVVPGGAGPGWALLTQVIGIMDPWLPRRQASSASRIPSTTSRPGSRQDSSL